MKKHKFALQLLCFTLLAFGFIACDKDFITLESDVITNENATNFDLESQLYDVVSYTQPLGPVQTNGLSVNSLGFYNDIYGTTKADFLSQLTLSTTAPEFGDEAEIDSVILTLPFFVSSIEFDDDGNPVYGLDSVFNDNPIKLRIFESNYFLRDFDPNGDFNSDQPYFSNKSASLSEQISQATLEGEELEFLMGTQTSHLGDNMIKISNEGFTLTEADDDDDGQSELVQRVPPGIRIKVDPDFWTDKIFEEQGQSVLASQSNFNNYFRGLYFKAELGENSGEGSYVILNPGNANSNITIYYNRLTPDETDEDDEREQATYTLQFGPIRTNFYENNFNLPINEGDPENGDTRIYLKGGEGSLARVKLFNGENEDNEPGFNEFETFKNFFVEENEDGELISKRLINEANLVFYVDQDMVTGNEPDRIYVYDIENKIPLADYSFDLTNNSIPSLSKTSHLGPLQRVDDEPNGEGIKYKLRLTSHINNLLLRDSTNVELGLAVSLNVNSENPSTNDSQQNVLVNDGSQLTAPISSVMSPKGTILHGNATEDESKRVYLEIFYAEPNN
ncbi:DUF4270 domain-containing protein [Winogradskyella sp. DF17]|uniref:DUF4270 domain-containing protein n=1 Tax=Winogradskyella pelagia TaxID=2819984 RepID=A0ABS3T5D3_9FLAO|nr:DUF4270 domain-containing protein [Winogradskyella sp. DF17]MBO3117963.1 DUF4270 domain-containing protein [Winogradskyella sp. DF17]